jgi:hypothetical protein
MNIETNSVKKKKNGDLPTQSYYVLNTWNNIFN